jgi:hypothetical protein
MGDQGFMRKDFHELSRLQAFAYVPSGFGTYPQAIFDHHPHGFSIVDDKRAGDLYRLAAFK